MEKNDLLVIGGKIVMVGVKVVVGVVAVAGIFLAGVAKGEEIANRDETDE